LAASIIRVANHSTRRSISISVVSVELDIPAPVPLGAAGQHHIHAAER
jgi:hypothetical protein